MLVAGAASTAADMLRGEKRTGEVGLPVVGDPGVNVGETALRVTRGAGAEKVGVTKGEMGAGENGGSLSSVLNGRGCTVAGH